MEALEKLLQLPYETLAILVAGYLAYRLAYTGRDNTHKALDIVAMPLVFAYIAHAASRLFLVCYAAKFPVKTEIALPLWIEYGVSFGGIGVALFAAAIWRRISINCIPAILRGFGISSSDRHIAAWETVINREDSGPTQITVQKKDGMAVQCQRLDDFKDSPFGPMILGQDGSIALYVTDYRDKSGEWKKVSPEYEDWGPEITIIPAGEISEVRIRHNPSLLRRWGRRRSAGKGSGVVGDVDHPLAETVD